MFHLYLHTYPNGIDGEEMECEFLEFATEEEAIIYADGHTSGLEFAGTQLEDEEGNLIYEITSDMATYHRGIKL